MSNVATQFKRQFHRNDDFFAEPNNINSYWSGVLAADGCITNNRYQRCVTLSSIDRDLIEKFKTAISYNGKTSIHIEKNGKSRYTVSVTLHNLAFEQLANTFSITIRKSKTLMPPRLYNEMHICNFIRGYMDGDGSIYGYLGRKNSKNKTWAISFNGTKEMLTWISNCIQKYVPGVGNPKVINHASIFKLTFAGKQSIHILDWLYCYSSQNIRLDRKHNKYLEARNG